VEFPPGQGTRASPACVKGTSMRFRPGPDPDFPYLDDGLRFNFPPPDEWKSDIACVGGNLSPGMLLSAYEQGLFPWYNPGDPILWQSPETRMVIFPETLRVSKSMRKLIDRGHFETVINRDFESVICACATTERPGQNGTWIDDDIIAAYIEMHRLEWAHSSEAYLDGNLVGGCYGISMGKVFFGESMFSHAPNASKVAFLTFAERIFSAGAAFIDCQVPTPHLHSLGGVEMPRDEFLALLKETLIPE